MQIDLYRKKIFIFHRAVDFRASIDGLSALVAQEVQANVQEHIYIFYNKAQDKVKILSWHLNGFGLFYKRLEAGQFEVPYGMLQKGIEMSEEEVKWLLMGLAWQTLKQWKALAPYETFS